MTLVDYPDPALDTSYTYDDPSMPFSQGRLTAITRDGLSVDYEYDRFGRTTRDGELTYAYDKNGNRIEIEYPGGEVARYTHDFADREATLELEPVGGSPEPIMTSATYYAGGPLSSLELGNGFTETRVHDQRYHPTRISVAPTGGGAALLDWAYTTDDVGNPTFIDDLLGGVDRQYGYQDVQYYLTQGNGPWGTLAWTHDRVGNRLSESRDGSAADVYSYQLNSGALGNTAQLTSIQHGSGGATTFSYDAAGNQTQTNAFGSVTDWTYDDESRLSRITRDEAISDFLYDGRSFLRFAESRPATIFCDGFESGDTSNWGSGPGTCSQGQVQETVPTYGSEGVLNAKDSAIVLYFASRPVAVFDTDVKYINVDHLGAPNLFTDAASAVIWEGGFEPFGGDFSGAMAAGQFLRLPGQWEDEAWEEVPSGEQVYYNVHRWYETRVGRYGRPDPLGPLGDAHPYLFGISNPIVVFDPFGLFSIAANCSCTQVNSPNDPTMGLPVERVKLEVDTICSQLEQQITEPRLRKCIEKSCQRGRITCEQICGIGPNGQPMIGVNESRTFGPFRLVNRRASLCLDNLPFNPRPGAFGDIVIHEWAHGCKWDHVTTDNEDGRGVPGPRGHIEVE